MDKDTSWLLSISVWKKTALMSWAGALATVNQNNKSKKPLKRLSGRIKGEKRNKKSTIGTTNVTFELSGPDPTYSSDYWVTKLILRSITHLHFYPGLPVQLICLYDNFLSVIWCFKKLFLLTTARRQVGSGSGKILWIQNTAQKTLIEKFPPSPHHDGDRTEFQIWHSEKSLRRGTQ
jgi:hypothetical protein